MLIFILQHLRHLIFIYFLKIHLSKGQVRLITHLSTGSNHLPGASGHRLFRSLLLPSLHSYHSSCGNYVSLYFTQTGYRLLHYCPPPTNEDVRRWSLGGVCCAVLSLWPQCQKLCHFVHFLRALLSKEQMMIICKKKLCQTNTYMNESPNKLLRYFYKLTSCTKATLVSSRCFWCCCYCIH